MMKYGKIAVAGKPNTERGRNGNSFRSRRAGR